MAWVTTQFGRLFLCFRFGSGAENTALCREPLHVGASREAKAEARRLAAKLQLEIDARTFDYAAWFPTSSRLRKLGLKPTELPTLASFTEGTWLPLKTLAVRRSTRAYYQDVFSALLAKSELASCRLNELSLEDIDRWRLWIDSRRTATGEKLSARRKNMARDVLCQILELARQHYRIDDLTPGLRVFRDADECFHVDQTRLDFLCSRKRFVNQVVFHPAVLSAGVGDVPAHGARWARRSARGLAAAATRRCKVHRSWGRFPRAPI
jgi:Arm DNA-binding domain